MIRLIALTILTLAYSNWGEARAQAVRSLSPDLAFHFDCEVDAYPPSDTAIEDFLSSRGFRVLNKVRLARKHHVEYSYVMDIFGLDEAKRMIWFMAVPMPPSRTVSVALNSPPPTHHDTELEDALLAFVTQQLGCRARQIRRGDNPESAQEMYERVFNIRSGWFRQAEELERPPG